MTPRDRILTALSRKEPDRVPKEIKFTPPMLKVFKEKTGSTDVEEYFAMEMREVKIDYLWEDMESVEKKETFMKYLPDLPAKATVDDWGIGYVPGSTYHFVKLIHPMKDFTQIKELEQYPFPDNIVESRQDQLYNEVAKIKDKELAAVGFLEMTIFEIGWYLRGMENLFVDLTLNKDFASLLLDKITDIRCKMAISFAKAGVDIIRLGDDIGTQRGMLMNIGLWRKWFKPRLAKVINEIHKVNPDIHIFYHSDGNITEVIPELIEIGIDVLNPVQPECMDPAEIKKQYGDRLAFWGTVGTQTTMPHGTPMDVKREVKERIEHIGKGGGLVIAPTHVIEPDVPWENIIAFIEAVKEYGSVP